MGPGESAVQSPGPSCLPGASRVHLNRPVSPETRTLLFTSVYSAPRTSGWGLWRGFGNSSIGGMADQPASFNELRGSSARSGSSSPDRCCSKPVGCCMLCLWKAPFQPAEVQVERPCTKQRRPSSLLPLSLRASTMVLIGPPPFTFNLRSLCMKENSLLW